MNLFFRTFLFLFSVLLFIRCGVVEHTPIVTMQDQTDKLHSIIEKKTADEYADKNYQSLSFSNLKVYKPEAFVQLDSIYRIKKEFLDNDDLRGLQRSGIEDLIPSYRAAAQQEIHQVQYEIEHLFQTSSDDSIRIYHSFFLFDYKDSLISVTPFYDYQISKKNKALYYAYQFDYHFVTHRDLYISKAELEFIYFFKQREIQLIGSNELQSFMEHTMKIMEVAQSIQTIDFRDISTRLAIQKFKLLNEDITIEKVGTLFALEKNDNVEAYELEIEWLDNMGMNKMTTFTFSPYLEINEVQTKFK